MLPLTYHLKTNEPMISLCVSGGLAIGMIMIKWVGCWSGKELRDDDVGIIGALGAKRMCRESEGNNR